MKKLLLCICLLAGLKGMSQGYHITGNLVGAEGKKVYLNSRKEDKVVKDSVQSADGSFSFAGTVDEPYMYSITVEGAKGGMPLFLENSNITVTGDVKEFAKVIVSGSREHDVYLAMDKLRRSGSVTQEDAKIYQDLRKNNDTVAMKKMEADFNKKGEAMLVEMKKFIAEHKDSYVSVYTLNMFSNGNIKPEEASTLLNNLSANVQNSFPASQMKKRFDIDAMLAVGRIAPEFVQNDVNGTPVKLSSLRGKYVLVDFWASWCKPCRAENPNVVKAYKEFKEKSFTVLGVSLDQPGKKDDWVKAIADDGLEWNHVSDLKFWDNAVAKQYGIRSIPANLLLDPEGKIIGKNLRGEDLEKALSDKIK